MGAIKDQQTNPNEFTFPVDEAQMKKLGAMNTSILTIYNLGRGLLGEYLKLIGGKDWPFEGSDDLTFEVDPDGMHIKVTKVDN